jgi:hypothetical protein
VLLVFKAPKVLQSLVSRDHRVFKDQQDFKDDKEFKVSQEHKDLKA